jgi:translocation and assembly module TamA
MFKTFAVLLCAGSLPAAATVAISGLNAEQKRNVEFFLELASADCDIPPWQLRRLLAEAPLQINEGLEALGFYLAQIDIADVPKEACWHKTISIDPGKPTLYRNVNVQLTGEGKNDAAYERLIARAAPKTDAVVNHGNYEQFKQSLQSLATQHGYFDARFVTAGVTIDETLRYADLNVEFDTGPRYRFGDVRIDSSALTDELFGVLTTIKQGSAFDANTIAATHRNFLESGYFSYVNINADPELATDHVIPVNIEAAAAKTRVYTGGLGFATDVGPRFRLNYRNRRINRRGHTLNGQLLASPVQSLLGIEYRIPEGDDRRDVLVFSSSVEDQDTDTSEFTSFETGLRRTRALDSGWLRTLALDWRREDFTVGDQTDVSTLLLPSINFWRGTVTTSARPKNAWRLSMDVRGTSDAIGSDTSFVQVEARARYIRSLNSRARLLTRLHLGATAKDQRDALPPSLRFFAGGDNSVRGYGFQTIGPTDEEGTVVGGSILLVGSLEFDYQLNDRWAVAAFVDSGSASQRDALDFNTGVGFGIRRLTPVGPLRIDLAAPLDLDRSVRLHFSIGSDL